MRAQRDVMPVQKLEHFTIRCADLERSRDFYCNILGLTVGDRPPLPFKGFWLYVGDTPAVHLIDQGEAEAMAGGPRRNEHTGPLDHVAFLGRDIEATQAALVAHGVDYREIDFPGIMTQYFIPDPDNIIVELTFR